MINDENSTKTKNLSELLGMKFNDDGSLSTASDVGNTPIFKRMSRKQRRNKGIYSHKFKNILKRV